MTSGYSAYARTHAAALSGAKLEKEALLKSARLLEHARTHSGDPVALGDALKFNLDLWTVFEADVSDPSSPLPGDLKKQLLDLSAFMDSMAERLIKGFDDDALQTMIDVNRKLGSN